MKTAENAENEKKGHKGNTQEAETGFHECIPI